MRLSFINYLTGVKISSDMAALGSFVKDLELELDINVGADGKIEYKNAKITNRDNKVKAGSNDVIQMPLNAHGNYGFLTQHGEDINEVNDRIFYIFKLNCLKSIEEELTQLFFKEVENKDKILQLAQRLKALESMQFQFDQNSRDFEQQNKAMRERLLEKLKGELNAIRSEINFLRGEIEKYKVEREQLLNAAAHAVAANTAIITDPLFKNISGSDPASVAKRELIVKDFIDIHVKVMGANRKIDKLESEIEKLNVQKEDLISKLMAKSPPVSKSGTNGAPIIQSFSNNAERLKLETTHPDVNAIVKKVNNMKTEVRDLNKFVTDVTSTQHLTQVFQNRGGDIGDATPKAINDGFNNVGVVANHDIKTLDKKDEKIESYMETVESLNKSESRILEEAQSLGIEKSDFDSGDMLGDEPPTPR